MHSSVLISQPYTNTFHCINILLHHFTFQVESEALRPNLYRHTTGKLSLSSQSSSEALMTHPIPGKPPHTPL